MTRLKVDTAAPPSSCIVYVSINQLHRSIGLFYSTRQSNLYIAKEIIVCVLVVAVVVICC